MISDCVSSQVADPHSLVTSPQSLWLMTYICSAWAGDITCKENDTRSTCTSISILQSSLNGNSRSCNSCLVRLAEQSFWLMKSSALRHQSKLVKSRACIQFGACWPILAIVGHEERQVHYLGNGCGETGRPKAPSLNRRDPCLGVPCSWCTWFDFNDLPYHLNSQPNQDLIILSSTLGL